MTWKVVFFETLTQLKTLCECTEYDNATEIAMSLRKIRVDNGMTEQHFGIVKGDRLVWATNRWKPPH